MTRTPSAKLSKAQRYALLCAYSTWHPLPLFSDDEDLGIRKSTLDSLVKRGLLKANSNTPGDAEITALGEVALGLKPMVSSDFHQALTDAVALLIPEFFGPECIVHAADLHDICVGEDHTYDITSWLSADRMLGALDLEKGNYIRFFDDGTFDILLACVCQRLKEAGFWVIAEFHPAQIVFIPRETFVPRR